MKAFFTLITALFLFNSSFSQSVKDEEITFRYIQYPLQNQGADIKTQTSNVYVKYEEDIKIELDKAKAEHDALVAEDTREYEQKLAEYPQILAEYEARYAEDIKAYELAKKEYDEKSAGLKIVEKQLLEKDTEPRKPSYYPPSKPTMPTRYYNEPAHQKIFDGGVLASSYLGLEGFSQANEGDLKIEVTMFGYEEEEPKLITEKGSEYRSNGKGKGGQTVTVYTYYITHKYRHPISLKVTNKNGKVLVDEIFPEISEWTEYKTNKTKERPGFSGPRMTEEAQNAIVEKNMKIIQEYINNNFGYPVKDRKTEIYYIKDKKVDYSDYQIAYETIYAAYNQYYDENDASLEKIKQAISIWEKAMKESNPSDKKARIDNDVTYATLVSLAEAKMWIGEYVEAEGYLNKTVSLKTSKKEEELVANLREFIKDQKVRAQAR